MPLYEYLCESCGERSEILQRFGDLPEVVCPSCGEPMRRLPSAPSFQFKGTGFYQTDYARKPAGQEGGPPRVAAGKSGERAGGKEEGAGDSAAGSKETTASPAVGSGTSSDKSAGAQSEPKPAASSDKKPASPGKE